MRKLAPSVEAALDAIGRSMPRIGLKPAQEKKIKGLRKKRHRRGRPVKHIDMVPEDATPERRREIELRERQERQTERRKRSGLYKRNAPPKPDSTWSTTDVGKTKAAAEKRKRRNERRMVEMSQGGWK